MRSAFLFLEPPLTIDPGKLANKAVHVLRTTVLVMLLATIAIVIAKAYGATWLPRGLPGHVELAYLAGAYWLVK